MPTARLLTGRPLVEFDDDGRRVLAREVSVDLCERVACLDAFAVLSPDQTTILTVPAGFVYDGASIPSLAVLSWVMGPRERFETAGLLHDWCYRVQVARDVADYVFWLVARSGSKHVGPVRAWLGWAGVRVGGWRAYRSYSDATDPKWPA